MKPTRTRSLAPAARTAPSALVAPAVITVVVELRLVQEFISRLSFSGPITNCRGLRNRPVRRDYAPVYVNRKNIVLGLIRPWLPAGGGCGGFHRGDSRSRGREVLKGRCCACGVGGGGGGLFPPAPTGLNKTACLLFPPP